MVNKKNLHFFTASFPFSHSTEGAFIMPEIIYTCKQFDKVYIYALQQKENITYNLPKNVEVIKLNLSNKNTLGVKTKFSIFFTALKESLTHKKFRRVSTFRYLNALLKDYYKKSVNLLPILKQNLNPEDTLYTYWFAEWNYILNILYSNNYIASHNKLVSRAHGFDLYNERSQLNKIPFRKLQLKNTSAIFTISDNGKQYLSKLYPLYNKKINVAKLGVFEKGFNNSSSDKVTLVSCSSISPVKRVHLIIEILKQVQYNITWVHFGDGKLMSNIRKKISELPSNITVKMKGFVKNEEVINFYKNENASLFINVSESEGIPVSIMEAISFGIPAIGFNVGGISEIINEQTGKIFNTPNNIKEMTLFVQDFPSSKYNTLEFRTQVKKYWNNEFNAEKNHSIFAQKISNI